MLQVLHKLNEKEMFELEKEIDYILSLIPDKGKNEIFNSKPSEHPRFYRSKVMLDEFEKNLIRNSAEEAISRIEEPYDKTVKDIFRDPNIAKQHEIMSGTVKDFTNRLMASGLELSDEQVIKIACMVGAFVSHTILKEYKNNPHSQITMMGAYVTNMIVSMRSSLDECSPIVRDSIEAVLPELFRTFITEGKLDTLNNNLYKRIDVFHEVLKKLKIDPSVVEKKPKYWRDDVYGK